MPDSPSPDPAYDDAVALAHRLLDMARTGETAQLAAAVDAGAPVNLSDPDGNTLVMLAAYHGNAATVAALVERGAAVDRTNDRGQTPLAGGLQAGAGGGARTAGRRRRPRRRAALGP